MTIILCPGQGSQSPGFLEPWLEISSFKQAINSIQEVIDLDLIQLGTKASAEAIKDTKIAQPLIVAAGIASYLALVEALGQEFRVSGTSGHSVGEITAGYVAGIFDFDVAAQLVNIRGREMAKAASQVETGMAAVVGGDEKQVLETISGFGLQAANYNGPGQIVAAGLRSDLVNLIANPPQGSRVVELQVAGAFHTEFMNDAKLALEKFAKGVEFRDPKVNIWTNRDGRAVTSGNEFRELLVNQITSPVRWDLTMQGMLSTEESKAIELLPGGTLTGIAKRAMPGVTSIALKTPADLEKAKELIES